MDKQQVHLIGKRTRKIVKNSFVPHKGNGFRPHLVRRYGIVFIITFAVFLQIGYNVTHTGAVLGRSTDISQQHLLAETNKTREANGKQPLKLDTSLSQAAVLKAEDMFTQQYWAHVAPNGASPWSWFKQAGYDYNFAGENLAKGFSNSTSVITAWMNSPEHRENLLSGDFSDAGFAIVSGRLNNENTTIIVALYGTKSTVNAAGATTHGSKVLAAVNQPNGLVLRLGIGIQSMTPAALGSITLLIGGAFISLLAHTYRHRLPKPLRQTWYRHHGLYKATALISLTVATIALYGGGQI